MLTALALALTMRSIVKSGEKTKLKMKINMIIFLALGIIEGVVWLVFIQAAFGVGIFKG